MSCPQMLTVTILLLLSSALLVRSQSVKAIEGENVILPCGYKVRSTSDITAMCWGRGACPSSKCNTALIWTDGYKVTFRSSDRYQLNGILRRGDVSLTIGQASLSDGGTYCCRIEHSGWFNDEKINIQLSMQKAPTTTPPPTTTTTTSTTPVLMTTVLPTEEETTTLLPTPERTTTPIPTPEEEAPLPPTAAPALPALTTGSPTPTPKSIPPWPLPEHTTTPTTTIPTTRTTAIPQPPHTASGEIDDPAHEIPPEATEDPDPREALSPAPEQNATSGIDHLIPEIIPEATEYPDPLSPEPDQNGMADLIYGNMTALEKRTSLPPYILITGICLSAVFVALAAMILVKMKWRKRGRYPVGFDPNLELVAHAEDPMSEAEVSQAVTLEAGNEEPNKTSIQQNGGAGSGEEVSGAAGGTVTLPCTYDATHKRTDMCWGRGECSLFTCNDRIIRTDPDGLRVTERTSNRYQLLGDIAGGDVSLTISNLTREDGGTYCCRVEIPGLNNDQIRYINLKVQEGQSSGQGDMVSTWSRRVTGVVTRKDDTSGSQNYIESTGKTSNYITYGEVTRQDDTSGSQNDNESTEGNGDSVTSTSVTPVKKTPSVRPAPASNPAVYIIPILALIVITGIAYRYMKTKKASVSAGPVVGLEVAASTNHTQDNVYIIE